MRNARYLRTILSLLLSFSMAASCLPTQALAEAVSDTAAVLAEEADGELFVDEAEISDEDAGLVDDESDLAGEDRAANENEGGRSDAEGSSNDADESADISNASVVVEPESYVYSGDPITPSVTVTDGSLTLEEGLDYELSFESNVEAGTATVVIEGLGDYTGTTTTATFTIAPASIDAASIASIGDEVWTGSALTPKPAVTLGATTLVEGSDYTLSTRTM